MSESPHVTIWPTVESIPVSAVTDDRPPGHLRPPRLDEVAGTVGTGRDTAGGAAGSATGGGRRGRAGCARSAVT